MLERLNGPLCTRSLIAVAFAGGWRQVARLLAHALPQSAPDSPAEHHMRIGMLAARIAALGGAAVVSMTSASRAQLPGSPVLQNAFANPGITGAVDYANLGGSTSYAGALAWAPGTARFQLSAGIGAQTRKGTSTRTVYGARINMPVLGAASSFGASVFAGYGAISGGGATDSTVIQSIIPVGATVSYRLAVGGSRGISVYGSPVYESIARGGGAARVSVFRGDLGVDIGITPAIGATLGIEFGGKQDPGSGKPSGTAFGAAISYAISAGR
jgi:hypothetical protein